MMQLRWSKQQRKRDLRLPDLPSHFPVQRNISVEYASDAKQLSWTILARTTCYAVELTSSNR